MLLLTGLGFFLPDMVFRLSDIGLEKGNIRIREEEKSIPLENEADVWDVLTDFERNKLSVLLRSGEYLSEQDVQKRAQDVLSELMKTGVIREEESGVWNIYPYLLSGETEEKQNRVIWLCQCVIPENEKGTSWLNEKITELYIDDKTGNLLAFTSVMDTYTLDRKSVSESMSSFIKGYYPLKEDMELTVTSKGDDHEFVYTIRDTGENIYELKLFIVEGNGVIFNM